ncbi:MAG: phosphoribosylglycinamide formyltransferase [Proteobacteria bacterium]|nr:phosphoribosylglycinamide formyltransferase [Pseudomonadota bacterium]
MSLSLTVLISGKGSNLNAILEAIDRGRCDARVGAVVSDKRKALGLELARERGIPTHVVRLRDYPERPLWDRALADTVTQTRPELVVLAGFMRLVGSNLLSRFPKRVINIHPSLLPSFPGVDAARQAIDAGVQLSGCTVHLVDHGVDSGPILAQAAVPVVQGETPAELHARIQRVEHRLLPRVIQWFAAGRRDSAESSPSQRAILPGADDQLLWPPMDP